MTHSEQSQKVAVLPQIPKSEQQYAELLGSHFEDVPSGNGFKGPHFPSFRTDRLIADAITMTKGK